MNIALGTAQFGFNYGVANSTGKINQVECRAILDLAKRRNVKLIDTAIAYGESEAVLGSIGVQDFKIISKIPDLSQISMGGINWVEKQVLASIKRLSIESLYGLLLHQPNQMTLEFWLPIEEIVAHLKNSNIIQKFGVSIYDPSDLDKVFEHFVPDIVQAPLNIFDRRLIASGWLDKLNEHGVEVHVRSVFLQGLLLMARENLPSGFSNWYTHFSRWTNWLEEYSADPVAVCLAAVIDPKIDNVIVGVDSLSQFSHIVQVFNGIEEQSFPNLPSTDPDLLNPYNWNY